MTNLEIVKHEGLDGEIWYILFRLQRTGTRTEELCRTTKLIVLLEKIQDVLNFD